MKSNQILFAFLIGLLSNITFAADVTLEVNNVISDRGHIVAALCERGEVFPRKCARVTRESALKSVTKLYFKNVPKGTFAITVFHDENDDGKLNVDASNIPAEGYGFSRDAVGHFGPPKFDDAAVAVIDGNNQFTINLIY